MKKILIVAAAWAMFGFSTAGSTVYVCLGKTAKKYHYSSNCRGLSNCRAEIVPTSLDQAVSSGRTLCGWED